MFRLSSVIASLVLAAIILSATVPVASGIRPVITSDWTTSPPAIDGKFMPSTEWSNPKIVIETPIPTYVYLLNDASNLYVMVDAVGDTHDNDGDECLLIFNFTSRVHISIIGKSGTSHSDSWEGVIGFDFTPNDVVNKHKMYEFMIPLSYIDAMPGQPVDFCSPPFKGVSMPFDAEDGRDNVWPSGLTPETYDDIEYWAEVGLALHSRLVGGELAPMNILAPILPWIALTVIASTSLVLMALSKRKFKK
jgi:hypothetical protein